MSDIFQEVDEEVRREQLKKLWDRYQYLVIAAVTLIVLGVAGWRGYQYWQDKKAAQAGSAFEAAITLSDQNKSSEAEAAFAKIATDGTPAYRALARVREAAELAKTDPKAAVALYDQISADSSVEGALRDLATLRAGTILVDTGTYSETLPKLEGLATSSRAFRHSAREMLALSAWRSNDAVAARRWLDMIATDAESPAGARSRVEILRTLLPPVSKG